MKVVKIDTSLFRSGNNVETLFINYKIQNANVKAVKNCATFNIYRANKNQPKEMLIMNCSCKLRVNSEIKSDLVFRRITKKLIKMRIIPSEVVFKLMRKLNPSLISENVHFKNREINYPVLPKLFISQKREMKRQKTLQNSIDSTLNLATMNLLRHSILKLNSIKEKIGHLILDDNLKIWITL
ncbi:MAG: hypothetical protein IPP71_08200 [Bacteroidetes bacterium]|nr:hypothetical protein [Bacteroidota bacterium]